MQKKSASRPAARCLITDASSIPMARGELLSPPTAPNIQIRITEGDVPPCDMIIQVMPLELTQPSQLGRVTRQRDMMIVAEPLRSMYSEMRENLRMPVDFLSYSYPQRGGRYPIRAHDLSCGGIAFYSAGQFQVGDKLEVVIPITEPNPLILQSKVLRSLPFSGVIALYACNFFDIIHDEERKVREAVFNVQLTHSHA